jgi:hypothetical protein
VLSTAHQLRHSSARRIWRTLLNFRDWPSYVWILLLACVTLTLPYALYKANKRAYQQRMVLTAIAETSPVYRKILDLLEHGPVQLTLTAPFEEVSTIEPPDFTGFEIVSDTRIYDLRQWSDGSDAASVTSSHMRLCARRTQENGGNTHLRFQFPTVEDQISLICRTESLNPALSRTQQSDDGYLWELDLDFSHVPIGTDAEIVIDTTLVSHMAEHSADAGRFQFTVHTDTGLAQIWMLMPQGRTYDYFEIAGYPIGKPELAQTVVPNAKVELPFGAIATFRLINPDANHRYECRWKWSEDAKSE